MYMIIYIYISVHWHFDAQEDFYTSLAKIQSIVSKPILSQEELDLLDGKASPGGVEIILHT